LSSIATVVEYSDFQCPFCARFASDTQAKLQQEYIDTGKVRFLYRDLPLTDIHPGALLAAHVANCAADQGSFWPMHDQLFQGAAARAWGQGDAADFNVFMGYAAALQLDIGKLQSCVQNNQFASQIQADMREATALGIRSTPTFVVNGQLLVGAQPIEVWRRALDGMLTQ
jgi:protein-disulfide isomerase